METNYDIFKEDLGEWALEFKPFLNSKAFDDIYDVIRYDKFVLKEDIVPTSENTFRTFKITPRNGIKSIWYLMDPYARKYKNGQPQATGIAMDCSNTPDGKLQPSLEKFYEAMEDDLGREVLKSPNLEYLCEQGVMMANSDLTCKLGKTGSHEGLWAPFQKFFLEEIMGKETGIVYILSGEASLKMEQFIQPIGNYIIKLEHPSFAARKGMMWKHENVFTRTNKIIRPNTGAEIFWNKLEYEELPF